MESKVRTARGHQALVLVDQGLLSGFAFLTTLVLLRGMGLSGFGMYSLLALGWLWGLGLVQALLIQPMQTLIGSRAGTRRRAYLAGCWRLSLGLVMPACLLGGGLVWVLGFGMQVAASFACFLLARTLQMQLRGAAFVVGDRWGAMVSDGIGQMGGFLAIVALAPVWHWSLQSILLIQSVCWGAAVAYSLQSFEGRGIKPLPLKALALRHWKFSRWLAGMAAVRWVSSNGFLLAVAAQFGPGSLAIMRGVQAVIGIANLGLAAMESVLPTGAALSASRDGESGLFLYLKSFALKGMLPVVLLIASIVLLAEPLVALVFGGEAPEGAVPVLLGLACLPACSFLYTLYSIAYRTLRRTSQMFWAYGLVALLVAGFAPLVVRQYGLVGAAWGMALQPLAMVVLLAVGLMTTSAARYGQTKGRS